MELVRQPNGFHVLCSTSGKAPSIQVPPFCNQNTNVTLLRIIILRLLRTIITLFTLK